VDAFALRRFYASMRATGDEGRATRLARRAGVRNKANFRVFGLKMRIGTEGKANSAAAGGRKLERRCVEAWMDAEGKVNVRNKANFRGGRPKAGGWRLEAAGFRERIYAPTLLRIYASPARATSEATRPASLAGERGER
jgi:hypothetical protein